MKSKKKLKKLPEYIYNNYYDYIYKIFKGELSGEELIQELEKELIQELEEKFKVIRLKQEQGGEMKVSVRLKRTSQNLEFEDVDNTYQQGDFYCIYIKAINTVTKIPIANIWAMDEDYLREEKRI